MPNQYKNGHKGAGGGGRRQGRGRMDGAFAAGLGGNCICLSCHTTVPHAPGQPCNQMVCPKCGKKMTIQQNS